MPNSNAGEAIPLIVSGNGTAGTPDTGVVSVQGIASGTPLITNLTQLNSVALGSPAAFGTSPGAVNALNVNASLFKGAATITAANCLFTNLSDGSTALSGAVSAWGTAPTGTEVMGVNANILALPYAVSPIFLANAVKTSGAGVTTTTITYTPIAKGNAIIIGFQTSAAITAVTVKDNNNNALTANPSNQPNTFMFYGFAVAGATSYTIAWTTSATFSAVLVEYASVSAFGPGTSASNTGAVQQVGPTLMSLGQSLSIGVIGDTVTTGTPTFTASAPDVIRAQQGNLGSSLQCVVIDENASTGVGSNINNRVTFTNNQTYHGVSLQLLPGFLSVSTNIANGTQIDILGNAGAILDAALGTAPTNALGASLFPVTSGGCSTAVSQALTTSINVKSTPGQLYGYTIYNPNASTVYIFWYNTATTPGTIGSTTNLLYQIGIPTGSAAHISLDYGVVFSTGIAVAVSTSATSSSAPGTGLVITTLFK